MVGVAPSNADRWRAGRVLLCASATLAVPLWWNWWYYRRLRSSLDPYPGWVKSPFPPDHLRQGWRLMFRSGLIGDCVLAFLLSLLACAYLRWRFEGGNKARIGVRVAAILGLLVLAFLSPWLAQGVGSFELPHGRPLDDWIVFRTGSTALPVLSALAASVLYFVIRPRRSVGAA